MLSFLETRNMLGYMTKETLLMQLRLQTLKIENITQDYYSNQMSSWKQKTLSGARATRQKERSERCET